MGRFAGLLAATGGERDRLTRLGKWFEVMSRVRDGNTGARGQRSLSLVKSVGGELSLSSPMGQAALRMSITAKTEGIGPTPVNTEVTAVEGNRRPTAVWFNDGHLPPA